jgi:hypothetical protein
VADERSAETMIQEIEFAPDSPLEGAVTSEPVSEVQNLDVDSGRVMDDSGIVKRCFAHEFGRKLYLFPEGSPRPPAITRCDYVHFRRQAPVRP